MSNFGQLMAVFDLINQIGFNAAQSVVRYKQSKGEQKLSEKEQLYRHLQAQEELKLRDRDYELKVAAAARQEKLFREIAIVIGVGVTLVAGIMGVSAIIFSRRETEENDSI